MSDTDRNTRARTAQATDLERRPADELDRLLDEALGETFPASDPISALLRRPTR